MPRTRAVEKLVQTTPGSRIGSYEIVEPLGAGAMGNVYRATDHRLGRDVALKALPDSLAHDDDALARFEREARLLAALNHPNIAAIYGIEESGTERFLVLELVPGETLEQVLRHGAVPVARALRIAIQVAAALEAAHDAEIIHRDLKPSNVKITPDSRVKLLDFGIAKYSAPQGGIDALSADLSLTRTGTMVGTPQYMSPEQVFGETVDRRTDVWAFGCLLFELLTGRVAFPGHSIIEIADAVRRRDPEWSALPGDTPAGLQRLVARCLRKDPHERLHHMGDARVELEEIASEHVPATRRPSRTFVIAAAAAFVAALAASGVPMLRRTLFPPPSAGPIQFTQLTSAEGVEQFPAWSPDGKSIVFAGDVGGIRKLFIKQIGSSDQERLTTGDQDDLQPAWSPDGRRILFVRARETHRRLEPGDVFGNYESDYADVWSIDLQTRRESRFAQSAYYPSFSPNGRTVAVDASWAGPRRIWTVDERGFNPQQVTSDSSEAVTHVLPRWSPEGTRIVYQRVERTKFDIALVDVRRRQSVAVTNDNYRKINPVWAGDGRAIYFSSDRGGGMNLWRVEIDGENKVGGPPRQLTSGAGQDVQIAVSPDGKRLAYSTLRQNADLWRLPLTPEGAAAGQPEQVIATTREDSRGAWSPDGKHIAFNSDRAGDMNLWIHSLEDHTTRQITRGAGGDFQPSWSPGRREARLLLLKSGQDGYLDCGSSHRRPHAAHAQPLPRHQSVLLTRRQADRVRVGRVRTTGALAHGRGRCAPASAHGHRRFGAFHPLVEGREHLLP